MSCKAFNWIATIDVYVDTIIDCAGYIFKLALKQLMLRHNFQSTIIIYKPCLYSNDEILQQMISFDIMFQVQHS